MNNIYIDKLPISCNECMCLNQDIEDGCHCNLGVFGCEEFYKFYGRHEKCPLILISDRLAEERKKVVDELKADIRSLFNSYANSLLDYCIWNINAYTHKKLYNNFKRVIKNRLDKVLDLFDKRIDQIERGVK